MGTCSSAQARPPRNKELTDVLRMYSELIQPDEFTTLIDFLKRHEIISDSWTLVNKQISSAPLPRSSAGQQCQTSLNFNKNSNSKSRLQQQRNDNQLDDKNVKVQQQRRTTKSTDIDGNHEPRHRQSTTKTERETANTVADTGMKQELLLTRSNVYLTGTRSKHHSQDEVSTNKLVVSQSESDSGHNSEEKTGDKNACQAIASRTDHTAIEKITALEEERKCLLTKIKQCEETFGKLQNKISTTEEELKALRSDKDQLARELRTEKQKCITNCTDLNSQSLRGNNSTKSTTIEKLHQTIAKLERQNGESDEKTKTLQLSHDRLIKELETEQLEHHTTRTNIGACEDEREALRLNKDQLIEELRTEQEKHHTTRSDLGKQITSLRGDNSVLLSNVEKLRQNVAALEKQRGACEDEQETLRLNKEQLQTEREKHHTTRSDLGKQITSLRGDNSVLLSNIDKLRQDVAMLEKKLGEGDESLKTLQVNNDKLINDLKKEQHDHHTTRTNLEKQVTSLRVDNGKQLSKLTTLQQRVDVLGKQLGACEDELETLRLNKDQLTQELHTEREGHHTTRSDLGKQITSLRGNNSIMASTIEKLKRNIVEIKLVDAEYRQSVKAAETQEEKLALRWRVEPLFDHEYLQKLTEWVEHYWPLREMGASEGALPHVNILFIGPIGAGKSSFLNSVESSFRGYVTLAAAAGDRLRSVTSTYRQYPVLASDNIHTTRFRLCDCRGLEDGFGITRDIDSILDGHIPDNYVFNSSFPMTRKIHGYKHNPRLEDKIHCVVYVLDAQKYSSELSISFMTEPVKRQIKTIQQAVDQRGIPQLAILSKVDNICEVTKHNTSMLFRSHVVEQRCEAAADCLGLTPMMVLPMKNYFWETSTTDDISILALYNIRQMLRAADTFLRVNHLNELRTE